MAGFPEHSINPIMTLIQLGFSSKKPLEFQGKLISPREYASQVLKKLKPPKGYKEIETLWAKVSGIKDGKEKTTEINCIVKSLEDWSDAGSNVDTGRTITIISQMIFNNKISKKGVVAPEVCVPHEEFLSELSKREIFVFIDKNRIN